MWVDEFSLVKVNINLQEISIYNSSKLGSYVKRRI